MSVDETPAPQVTDPSAEDTSVQTEQSETGTQTNEVPEATQAQEANEVKAEDTTEGKLYAGKYKSVEDMEKAYQELNSKFTNTSQEKAELAKILNDAFITPEPQPQAETETEYQEESTQVDPEIQQLKAQVTVQSFIMTHENADAEAMGKVLNEDPIAKQIPDYQARLEYAYLRSQNMGQKKAIVEAEKKSAEQTQAKIIEKQAAQVESASKADTTNEDSELMRTVTSSQSTQAQSDAARQALIRKHLVNL